MFCKNCGKQISEGVKFCKYCGVEIATREEISSTQKFSDSVEQNISTKTKNSFNKRVNYSKFIKYSIILLIIFFVVLAFSEDEEPNNEESSTKINELVEIEKNYNSLLNGTIIYSLPYYLEGLGELKIENGTDYDTVVKLIRTSIDESVYTTYIKAKNSHKINEILDGKYILLFMHGRNWDEINQTFLVDKSHSKFEDDFDFITREITEYDGTYEEYSTYTVTLHPVHSGTAETNDISEDEFDKY